MKVYMIVENNEFELPMLVSDSMKEIASYLGITIESAYCATTRHNVIKKKFLIERVSI